MEKVRIGEIEGVIFATGEEGVEKKDLERVFELSSKELESLLEERIQFYKEGDFGIRIYQRGSRYYFGSKEDVYSGMIRYFSKPKTPTLTSVQMETLAIVAFAQPVTKQQMEHIRGVKCDYAVNKLVEYGLIEESGRLEGPGKPILFRTTQEFLKIFGLSKLEDLPQISTEEIESITKNIESQVQ